MMDRTGYTRGDVANQHGVPVPADNSPRAAHARDETSGVGPALPCPEGCTTPEGESRESEACEVCRGCGLVTAGRVLRCYPEARAREIIARAMLVEPEVEPLVPWSALLKEHAEKAEQARRSGTPVVTASQGDGDTIRGGQLARLYEPRGAR